MNRIDVLAVMKEDADFIEEIGENPKEMLQSRVAVAGLIKATRELIYSNTAETDHKRAKAQAALARCTGVTK